MGSKLVKHIRFRVSKFNEWSHRQQAKFLRTFGVRYAKLSFGKIKLWVDLEDGLGWYFFVYRNYEPYETSLIQQVVRPGMTILDVGAHVGYYTLLLALSVGETGKVIAFEPEPSNFELLRRNVLLNRLSNVICEQAAVLDHEGRTTLYLSSINKGDHRVFDARDDDRFNSGRPRSMVLVQTIMIDKYLRDHRIKADLVKMDIQGAEMLALRGMTDTLSDPNVVLFCEFWPYALRKAGSDPMQFLGSLKGLGIELFEIVEAKETVLPVQIIELCNRFSDADYANLICVHRSWCGDIPFLP